MRALSLLLAAAALATPTALGAGERSGSARLAILDRSPLVVRGTQFGAGERVTLRVLVFGMPRGTRVVTASARGTWVARFRTVHVPRCKSFVVRATGARGSKASSTEHQPPCLIVP